MGSVRYHVQACSFLLFLSCFIIASRQEPWVLPDNSKRFDQISFLAAHNAYANEDDGWRYAQQKLSLQQQLQMGVRGFLLDIYYRKGKIILCHGGYRGFFALLKAGSFRKLNSAFAIIQRFIEENPDEIITIFLENYVNNTILKHEIESNVTFCSLLLTHKDWNPKEYGCWPTLGWMQQKNKRIIIFNEDKSRSRPINNNDPFFSIWDHIVESRYGTTNIDKVCSQRRGSKKGQNNHRSLTLLNYFGSITFRSRCSRRNSYKRLRPLVMAVSNIRPFKTPNWIALDYVDRGDPLRLVNELNSLHE